MYKSISGTLVVLVPSSEGLVVAADSRAVHRRVVLGKETERQFSDGVYKIVEVARPFRTVISVTGTGVIHDVPEEQAGDMIKGLATAPRLLDIPSVVKSCLESGPKELNEEIFRNEIPTACQTAVRKATAPEHGAIRQYEGKVLCVVVVANYSWERKCSTIASFAIFIEPQSIEPTIRKSEIVKFPDEHQRDIRFYGETDYVRKYLNKEEPLFESVDAFTNSGVFMGKTVRETSAKEAEDVAVNLIEAASEKAKSVPPESGIGGPIDVVLLGVRPEPLRLRWK